MQVCVYEDTNFGGQYVEQSVEAKTPGVGSLPHAQNFAWGQSYLPDRGTVCAIPTEAPTPQPTIVLGVAITATPTMVPPTPTEAPTEVPTESDTPTPETIMPPPLSITAIPTDTPTPEETPMLPPAQLPLPDYAK